MIRRPPRSTLSSSSAASDVYKRQFQGGSRCTSSLICVFAAQRSSARRPPRMRHVHTGLFREKRGARQVLFAVFATQRSTGLCPVMDDRSTQVCFREVRGVRQVSSASLRLRLVSGRFAVYVRSHLRLCGSGLFQGGSRCRSGLSCVFAAQRSSARRPPWMRHVHTGLCQGEARRTSGLICCLCYAALDWLVPRHG